MITQPSFPHKNLPAFSGHNGIDFGMFGKHTARRSYRPSWMTEGVPQNEYSLSDDSNRVGRNAGTRYRSYIAKYNARFCDGTDTEREVFAQFGIDRRSERSSWLCVQGILSTLQSFLHTLYIFLCGLIYHIMWCLLFIAQIFIIVIVVLCSYCRHLLWTVSLIIIAVVMVLICGVMDLLNAVFSAIKTCTSQMPSSSGKKY